MRTRQIISVAILAATIPAGSALAGNCGWKAVPTNINFGNYSVFSGSTVTGDSSFTVTCTPNQTLTLKLSKGTNSAGFSPRTMKVAAPGTDLLSYNTYVDASHTQIWGDGTGGTTYYEQYNSSPGNKDFTDTIYGLMPVAADAPAGAYQDIITAALSSTGGSTLTQTFTVSATVLAECTVSTFAMNFGSYDPLIANASTPLDSTAVLSVYCTKNASGTVSLDAGVNPSGTRRMKNAAGAYLKYDIYVDSGRVTVWDTVNTRSGTSTSRFTALSGGFTAYGRIPSGQDVAVGSYNDTVVATVNY